MGWKEQTARDRIRALMNKSPQVNVRRFSDEYLPEYQKRRNVLAESGKSSSPPLFELPVGTAVLVDTVQIYIQMVNYDEFRLSEGRETEASHQRALQFLHLYYSACDRLAEKTSAQRVDFHGARMHAAVLDSGRSSIRPGRVLPARHWKKLWNSFENFAKLPSKQIAS